MSSNATSSDFRSFTKNLTSSPTLHASIPNDTVVTDWSEYQLGYDGPPRLFYIEAPGILTITDALGVALQYTVLAGQRIIFEGATAVSTSSGCVAYAQW